MADKDSLYIKLHVRDRDMGITIPRADEAYYRRAAKLVGEVVNAYMNIFKGKREDTDILYMAMIDLALRYEKESGRNDVEPYNKLLQQLTSEMEDLLK